MKTMTFRYYKPKPLVLAVLGMATASGVVVHTLILPLVSSTRWVGVVSGISTTSIVLVLLALYDRYLWNRWFFRRLVTIPDLSGKYKGVVRFERDGVKQTKNVEAVITQTASLMTVRCRFFFQEGDDPQETRSTCHECHLVERGGYHRLDLFYLNEGVTVKDDLGPHEGSAKLDFEPENSRLIGPYYTRRRTKGEMELIRTMNL